MEKTKSSVPANIVDYLKLFKETGFNIFGEDKFDVYTKEVNKKFWAIIKYPEIKIRNSRGTEHEMKELYIVIQLSVSGNYKLSVSNIMGFRGLISMSEYLADYWHSHLNWSRGLYNPIDFCLSNSEISMVRLRINALLNSNGSIEDLKHEVIGLYLLMDTLATWESLEGGPHRKISNILTVSSNKVDYRNPNPTDLVINETLKLLTKADLEVVQDQVNIKDSPELTKRLLEYNPAWITYKDSDGYVFGGFGQQNITAECERENNRSTEQFKFKGVGIKTLIDLTVTNAPNLEDFEKVVNPNIILKLNQKIQDVNRRINFKEQISGIKNAWKNKTYITFGVPRTS